VVVVVVVGGGGEVVVVGLSVVGVVVADGGAVVVDVDGDFLVGGLVVEVDLVVEVLRDVVVVVDGAGAVVVVESGGGEGAGLSTEWRCAVEAAGGGAELPQAARTTATARVPALPTSHRIGRFWILTAMRSSCAVPRVATTRSRAGE
jgi:hypothetical protein